MNSEDRRADAPSKIRSVHRAQIDRGPWPDFESFSRAEYSETRLRSAALDWERRANLEYASVHEFAALLDAMTRLGAPASFAGALARLLTDEARHTELCQRMTEVLRGAPLELQPVTPPYAAPPSSNAPLLQWAIDVVLTSCCIGETLSIPMYEALVVRTTDPVAEATIRQIRRDEYLHSTFGWETLEWLLGLSPNGVDADTQRVLSRRLGQFERGCYAGVALSEVVDFEHVIEPSTEPNLGTLSAKDFAVIFYATIESEVLPRFDALGFRGMDAWKSRYE